LPPLIPTLYYLNYLRHIRTAELYGLFHNLLNIHSDLIPVLCTYIDRFAKNINKLFRHQVSLYIHPTPLKPFHYTHLFLFSKLCMQLLIYFFVFLFFFYLLHFWQILYKYFEEVHHFQSLLPPLPASYSAIFLSVPQANSVFYQ